MGLAKIACCKCYDPLPHFAIFPCGHFLCLKCKTLKTCQECQRPVGLVKDTLSLQYLRKTSKESELIKKNSCESPSSSTLTPKARTSKVRNRSSLSSLKLVTRSSASLKHPENRFTQRPTRKIKVIDKIENTVEQLDESSQEGDDVFINSGSRINGKKLIRVTAVVHAQQSSDSSQSNTQEDVPKDPHVPSPLSDFVGFNDDLPSKAQLDNFMSFVNKPANNVKPINSAITKENGNLDEKQGVVSPPDESFELSKIDMADHSLDESVIGPSLPHRDCKIRRPAKKRKLMNRLSKENSKATINPNGILTVQEDKRLCERIQCAKLPHLESSNTEAIDSIGETLDERGGLEPMELSRSCCDESAILSPENLQDKPSFELNSVSENDPLRINGVCSTAMAPLHDYINKTPVSNGLILKGTTSPTCLRYSLPNELPLYPPKSVESLSKSNCQWYAIHNQLSKTFSKLYEEAKPESLAKLAFDTLLLPMKTKEIFLGCEKVSPITESSMKGVQVDLFMEQSTVKVDLGREPAKRNSLIRRQLSFKPDESFIAKSEDPAAESEDIVEGTPTKHCTARVNLLNDSVHSPSSKTLSPDNSPMFTHPLISDSQEKETTNDGMLLTPQTHDGTITSCNQQPLDNTRAEEMHDTSEITNEKIDNSSPVGKHFDVPRSIPTSTDDELAKQSSFYYNDSDSIIGDSEQICDKKKSRLALPLSARGIQNLLEGSILLPPSPAKIMDISEITSSGLYSKVQLEGVEKLCSLMGAKFNNKDVTRHTSHLIIPEQGAVNVTAKFLMALYIGAYILPYRYVVDCLRSNQILNEVGYIPDHPGIKRRLALPRDSYLFEDYAFHICSEIKKNDIVNYDALEKLLKFCNCKTSESEEDLRTTFASYRCVILRPANYSQKSPKGCDQPNEVNFQWFYASLSSYQIQPFEKPLI